VKEILAEITALIKAIGSESMVELVKSKWVKFSIGTAILLLPIIPYMPDIIRAVQGR